MRNAFAQELLNAAQDERVVLLSGDIGNRLFNPYKERFGDRFYNCGVAEQNMIGVAAGLAMSGLKPIAYTIGTFLLYRTYEQIKLDVCYNQASVVLVAVGAGLAYAGLGPTHHLLEDLAIMRALPDMTVVCPADAMEVRAALHAALAWHGPIYLRIGKKNEPVVHESVPDFTIGRSLVLRPGGRVQLLACGTTLPLALQVADALSASGTTVGVQSFHTVKPLDTHALGQAFASDLVVTLEEHSVVGGFGSAVSEWAVAHRVDTRRLLPVGVPDAFFHKAGSQSYAWSQLGLDCDSIVAAIEERL